jgi:carbamate kinase
MRVVVALGGNALLRRGEPLDAGVQRANVRVAAEAVAEIARDHEVVLTHGNGPQVGLIALQNAAYASVPSYPFDVLGAESEGMIGYLLEQELGRHLAESRLATLLTQVVVDRDDPAFASPTKPVGPVYTADEARRLQDEQGWSVAADGVGWRRVMPSPEPREIVEINTIRLLVRHGITVTCAGGGGIPVLRCEGTGLVGVEAVIDKDKAAALLATALGADALLLLTDVRGVYDNWGADDERLLRDVSPQVLRAMTLPTGSMGPKVEAACRFIEAGGRLAAIGSLDEAAQVLVGAAGTVLRR